MTLIQVALLAGLIFIGLYMYVRLRSSIVDLLMIFFFMAGGIFLVLFPDYSNKLAHWVGVGRGADLVFYGSILFFLFLIMKLYARIRRLEQQFTEITREKSITEAEENTEAKDKRG
jgi:small membrane protein